MAAIAPPLTAVVAEVNRRLQRIRPEALQRPATFHFWLTGEGGGDFYCVLGNGLAAVGLGAPLAPASCTVTLQATDAVALVTGNLEPISAYFRGRIKVQGNFAEASRLGTMLRAAG